MLPLPKRTSYAILAVILLASLLLRYRMLDVPLERDEGEYAYAGQLLLEGIPPFKLAYNMKMPGIYAAYAAIMAVFGQSSSGIHLGLGFVNVLSTILLFFLVRRFFGETAALSSAALFALLALSKPILGAFAHATHFVVLFALLGTWLLLRALERNTVPWHFLAGLAFGVSFTMKQHALPFMALAGCVVLWSQWRARASMRPAAIRAVAFGAGCLTPFGVICLAMLASGSFGAFWFWTVDYARAYVSTRTLEKGFRSFISQSRRIIDGQFPIWIMALVGLIVLAARPAFRRHSGVLALIAGASLLAIVPGLYFREHYYVLVLPVISILAGTGVVALVTWMLSRQSESMQRGVSAAIISILLVLGVVVQWEYLFVLSNTALSRSIYGFNPFVESVEVGAQLARRAAPDDKIAVLGSEPQIYFYAQRKSATGFVYMYPLLEDQPYALEMQKQMITEIEQAAPRFLVSFMAPTSWTDGSSRNNDQEKMKFFEWMDRYSRTEYTLIGVLEPLKDGGYISLWDDAARQYRPQSGQLVGVFERKAKG